MENKPLVPNLGHAAQLWYMSISWAVSSQWHLI